MKFVAATSVMITAMLDVEVTEDGIRIESITNVVHPHIASIRTGSEMSQEPPSGETCDAILLDVLRKAYESAKKNMVGYLDVETVPSVPKGEAN